MIKEIKEHEIEEILAKEEVSVLYFSAAWCGPCKMMAPILDKLSEEINIYKVDVDKDKELAEKFKIQGVPTIMIMNYEENTKKFVGYTPFELIKENL